MPFIKIELKEKEKECNHPEHNPPSHIYLKDGDYTWECPNCGKQQSFTHCNLTSKKEFYIS
jgi:hypothetical protein